MGSLIFSLLLTAAVYMAFPLLRLALNHGKFEERQAKKIALWNSIVLGLLFCILTSAVTDSSSAWNAAPAVLYYWINCALLTKKQKNPSMKNTSPVSQAADPHFLGTDSQIVYCRKCGSKLPSDSNFCSKCGEKVCAETPEPAPVTASSVDAEKQYTAAALNKSSHRSDPWEVSRPAPKKNIAKIVCLCAFILFVATAGIILFSNSNDKDNLYVDVAGQAYEIPQKMNCVILRCVTFPEYADAEDLYNKIQKEYVAESTVIKHMNQAGLRLSLAQDGGIGILVLPGDFVSEVDSWCFDDLRKDGDSAIIENVYGYSVCYVSKVFNQ